MSGSSIAYHLRPNKAIDRNLFIDLLSRVGRVRNISDYEYIGFGGPFLEDFKAMHAALRIKKMYSIELDENTYARQHFNTPFKFVTLNQMRSDAFFRGHQFSENGTIVWLDNTTVADLKSQLDEFRSVVASVGYFDVVKITLNAHPACIPGKQVAGKTQREVRFEHLRETIGEYLPADAEEDDLAPDNYPALLQACLRNSVARLSEGETNRYFQILSSFIYKDGQQMLTVTGVVLDAANEAVKNDFLAASRIAHWPFSNLDWGQPKSISVPSLSAKERLKLDESLPVVGDDATVAAALKASLGYVPGEEEEIDQLANYARYYRAYPHFSRVIL